MPQMSSCSKPATALAQSEQPSRWLAISVADRARWQASSLIPAKGLPDGLVRALYPLPFAATVLRPDSLAFMLMHLMRGYAIQNGLLPEEDANAWFAEQEQRATDGRFFFSITHFIAIATKR